MSERRPPSLLVVAAEASGDRHAAEVVRAARGIRPDLEVSAFGGEHLREAGCRILSDPTRLSSMVIGFLAHLRTYVRLLRDFDRELAERRPDAVLLVDSPGLNFLLARLARWRRVPIAYYICPQIWAWAPWRRGKVLRYTDLLMPILPFEEELYRGGAAEVRFVGHPLADELAAWPESAGRGLRDRLDPSGAKRILGVFPGSRDREVEALSGVFLHLAREMGLEPEKHLVAVSACRPEFVPVVQAAADRWGVSVEIVEDDVHPLMMACDLALVASGTASLELAWFEKPMLVLYRTTPLGRRLFSIFSVTPWIALPNILGLPLHGDEPTVIERLFTDDPAEELAADARALLDEGEVRTAALGRLRRLRTEVFRPGGAERAARTVLGFIGAGEGAGRVEASRRE